MNKFHAVFKNTKSVIGMIHIGALPGTPRYNGSVQELVDNACEEAEIYKACHMDGIILENMHDIPYVRSTDFQPEVTSVITRVTTEVKKILPPELPCGIQVLAGGNREAIAIAKACQLQFVRVEGFVFSHIGDEGLFDACAGPLLRYRRYIDADSVLVFADIKKKHSSHKITEDVSIEETAKAAEFFLSDGVILTGTSTGMPADRNELTRLKNSIDIPVIIGSGITQDNIQHYIAADAFIIGSYFKQGGRWENKVLKDRVMHFMAKVCQLRRSIQPK